LRWIKLLGWAPNYSTARAYKRPGTGFWLLGENCNPMISGSASGVEKFVRSKNNFGSAWTA
jgi:hypothetical protein